MGGRKRCNLTVALLTEGVDRNCWNDTARFSAAKSPSSRRAWIEIFWMGVKPSSRLVALLAEGVDRNSLPQLTAYSALHPGIANLSPVGLIVRGAKQKQQAA